jgi:hypothetical protein
MKENKWHKATLEERIGNRESERMGLERGKGGKRKSKHEQEKISQEAPRGEVSLYCIWRGAVLYLRSSTTTPQEQYYYS